jgi:hypothetical protein
MYLYPSVEALMLNMFEYTFKNGPSTKIVKYIYVRLKVQFIENYGVWVESNLHICMSGRQTIFNGNYHERSIKQVTESSQHFNRYPD